MSRTKEERLQEAHNRGQKDGSDGKYDNPYNSWYHVIFENGDTNHEMRQAYIKGFDHARENPPKKK